MSEPVRDVPGSPACPVCGALYFYFRGTAPDGTAFERLHCNHIASAHPTYTEARRSRRKSDDGDAERPTAYRRDIDD